MTYNIDIGNEFWYQFDLKFLPSSASIDIMQAYGAVGGPDGVKNRWELARSSNGTFPDDFEAFASEKRDAIALVSNEQKEVFDEFFNADFDGLRQAFEDFGQGILFDDRRPNGDKIHKMDTGGITSPPIGYHRWHPFIRAQAMNGLDLDYWLKIDRLVGLAWQIQSEMKPVEDKPDNPRMNAQRLRELREKWLKLDFHHIDAEFNSYPYPKGGQ